MTVLKYAANFGSTNYVIVSDDKVKEGELRYAANINTKEFAPSRWIDYWDGHNMVSKIISINGITVEFDLVDAETKKRILSEVEGLRFENVSLGVKSAESEHYIYYLSCWDHAFAEYEVSAK